MDKIKHLVWRCDSSFINSTNGHGSIFLFPNGYKVVFDFDFFLAFHLLVAEQVNDLFIVDFDEGSFDDEFNFLFSFFNLNKKIVNNSGNDSHFINILQICRVSSHSVRFSTPCLSISQHSCIVPFKASHHKLFHAPVIHVLLGGIFPKHSIKSKALFLSNDNII